MAQLVDAYLRARPGDAAPPGAGDTDALERTLAALAARGRAAHPQIALDDVVFAAHLGSCGAPCDADTERHAEDLFLCCAGLLGHAGAVRTLREAHRPVLAGYLQRIDSSPAFVDEVEQRLWDFALIGSVGAPPKLGSYSGKGPLAGWLGVIAQRIGLMIRRSGRSDASTTPIPGAKGPKRPATR